MSTIALKGKITEQGTLEATLPSGLPVGDVRLVLEFPEEQIQPHPRPGAELVQQGLTGCWKDQGIEDSQHWLETKRSEGRRLDRW